MVVSHWKSILALWHWRMTAINRPVWSTQRLICIFGRCRLLYLYTFHLQYLTYGCYVYWRWRTPRLWCTLHHDGWSQSWTLFWTRRVTREAVTVRWFRACPRIRDPQLVVKRPLVAETRTGFSTTWPRTSFCRRWMLSSSGCYESTQDAVPACWRQQVVLPSRTAYSTSTCGHRRKWRLSCRVKVSWGSQVRHVCSRGRSTSKTLKPINRYTELECTVSIERSRFRYFAIAEAHYFHVIFRSRLCVFGAETVVWR